MNRQRALEILGDAVQPDGSILWKALPTGGHWAAWSHGDERMAVNAGLTADQLEALAWWMRTGGKDGEVAL